MKYKIFSYKIFSYIKNITYKTTHNLVTKFNINEISYQTLNFILNTTHQTSSNKITYKTSYHKSYFNYKPF